MLTDSAIVENAKAVVMNERKTNYYQWWSWICWVVDYRIYSVEIVKNYYMELDLGAFSDMDRNYSHYFIIGGANYFGKAIKTNDKGRSETNIINEGLERYVVWIHKWLCRST